jgi:Tfp pilus assembly protein PilV
MKYFKLLQQTGDTIVEVLIAMSVIGFIIGTAYVITNTSTTEELQSQERSDALLILQTQIESMRTTANEPPPALNTPFCMTQGTGTSYTESISLPSDAYDQFSSTPPTSPAADGLTEYAPDCNFSANGTSRNTTEPNFHVFIIYTNPSGYSNNSGIYTLNARWYSANGSGVDNMILYYKVN